MDKPLNPMMSSHEIWNYEPAPFRRCISAPSFIPVELRNSPMDLIVPVPHRPNPILVGSLPLTPTSLNPNLFALTTPHSSKTLRRKLKFRASASADPDPDGAVGSSWSNVSRSLRRGSMRFWVKFGEMVKKETGLDLEDGNVKVGEFVGRARDGVKTVGDQLGRSGTYWVSEFVDWNRWERWKVTQSIAVNFISWKNRVCFSVLLIWLTEKC